MDVARAQLDEALSVSGLRSQEQIWRLVEESQVRNGVSTGAPGTSVQGSTKKEAFGEKAAEIWTFLEGMRGAEWKEGAADGIGGSGPNEWKVHETFVDDFRVTYREAPGDMASHSICVEGAFNEATKSDFGSSWVASHGDAEGHQSAVHTFKAARAQRQAGSHRQHPFNTAEVLVEEFALGNDVTLLLVGAPSYKNGSHPPIDKHPLATRPIGCFLFKRTSASQCYFRAVADVASNQKEEAQALVTAVGRQLAGLGAAVFEKISARDFRDPSETAIRVTLKKGDAELGSVVITAFEKIKHDLGERLRKPGVVDRDALSAWLKAAKMDVAGEPKVEFRPVEGCSSEELSKALLELESCGSNLDNVTTPGGVHLEVTIGGVKQSGNGQLHADTSSPLAVGEDSESEAEFLDSAEELKQEEDSESEASTRERGLRTSESVGASGSKSPKKLESRPVDAHAPSTKPERNASKDKASGGAATVGRPAVTVRGGSASKKTIGRKRPAEALESVEDVLAKLASAVREVESEPSTSHGHPPKTGAGAGAGAGAEKKEKERDVVLGLGPGISHRQGGAKAPNPSRKEDATTAPFVDFQGGATPGSGHSAAGGVPSMEINPLERGGEGALSAADEDSDGPPSMVGSEEESEDELPPPRQDFMTITDPDILRARILELTARAEQLDAKSRQSTEWAHEKVMQAARKGQKDSAELKVLRAEVEAAKQRQRDSDDRERGLTKKLRDSEDMVKRTQDYAKGLEKKLFMLEKHLKEVRSELEASLLKESETAAREAKALKAEKVLQKKTAAWEKQRKAMQEEINGERSRANGLAAAAERAEESARQASVRARQEERAAREAGDRAAAEKRARELAEKDHKRKDAAAKKVSDTAAEKFRAEIARLEREVARLKLAEHGTVYGFEAPPPVYDVLTSLPREATLREENARLRREVAGLAGASVRRERECVMCMSEEQSVVFLPCAHQVLCEDCNQEHEKKGHKDCPSCRTAIVQRIKVYGK